MLLKTHSKPVFYPRKFSEDRIPENSCTCTSLWKKKISPTKCKQSRSWHCGTTVMEASQRKAPCQVPAALTLMPGTAEEDGPPAWAPGTQWGEPDEGQGPAVDAGEQSSRGKAFHSSMGTVSVGSCLFSLSCCRVKQIKINLKQFKLSKISARWGVDK